MSEGRQNDIWRNLRQATQARIGLTRIGHAITTRDLLDFQHAHALARDAVLTNWDVNTAISDLRDLGLATMELASQTRIRTEYLQRPDLGRALKNESRARLAEFAAKNETEIAVIVSDGLSAKAIETHFVSFMKVFAARLASLGFKLTPIFLVPFGRVGIADGIGEVLKARISIIFVGERPGLSSTDSMGIYLTYAPKKTNSDAQRNCISNVRPPEGLSYENAADKLVYLIRESLRLKLSGVDLKEDAHPVLHDVSPLLEL